MRRIIGLVIFALGLLFFVLTLLKVVHGLGGTSITVMLVGLIAFGVSFVRKTEPGPDAPPPMSVAETITTVFYDPDPVFKNLRHYPKWLTAFLIMIMFGVAYQFAFTNRVTAKRIADETERRTVDSGLVSPENAAAYKEQVLQDATTVMGNIKSVISAVGWGFVLLVFFAGLYLLCVLAFGGRMDFWQALSVAAYGALPPIVILTILNFILLYAKSPEEIDPLAGSRALARADLGLLFNPSVHPVLYVIGSFIGLFSLYGWWLTVSGLHNAATKLSKASGWTIALILWLLGLTITVIFVSFYPGIVSRT